MCLHGQTESKCRSYFVGGEGAPLLKPLPRDMWYPPHSHDNVTTHLILRGELTITYPDDASPKKETFGVGARLDVEAGRKHEVWIGSQGCTYVIGE